MRIRTAERNAERLGGAATAPTGFEMVRYGQHAGGTPCLASKEHQGSAADLRGSWVGRGRHQGLEPLRAAGGLSPCFDRSVENMADPALQPRRGGSGGPGETKA